MSFPEPAPQSSPTNDPIEENFATQTIPRLALTPQRLEIFKFLDTFNDSLAAFPNLRVVTTAIRAAMKTLVANDLSSEQFVNPLVGAMEYYPEGKDAVTRSLFFEPITAEIQLQKCLELALIVAIISKNELALNQSLFSIGRYLNSCAASSPVLDRIDSDELRPDYDDYVDTLKNGQLNSLRHILTLVVKESPHLLVNVSYHLDDLPEFRSIIFQELYWELATKSSLSPEQLSLAQVLQGDTLELNQRIYDIYLPDESSESEQSELTEESESEDDVDDSDLQTAEVIEINSSFGEGAEVCLCFATELKSAYMCFHARHGSLKLSVDHYETTESADDLLNLGALLSARLGVLKDNPYSPDLITAHEGFQQEEADFAFQERFIKKLLQLNKIPQALVYFEDSRKDRNQMLPDEPCHKQTFANFVIAYLPINQFKAEAFLDRLFELKSLSKNRKEFLADTFIAIEGGLAHPLVQDRLLKEMASASSKAIEKITARSIAILAGNLLICERYDELTSLREMINPHPKLQVRLVDAYLDASYQLNTNGRKDSAMLALEEGIELLNINIHQPVIESQKIVEQVGDYFNQIKKILRTALEVGKDDFVLRFIPAIQKSIAEIKDQLVVSECSAEIYLILAEAYFESHGLLSSKPLKEYFRNYNDPQYEYGNHPFSIS